MKEHGQTGPMLIIVRFYYSDSLYPSQHRVFSRHLQESSGFEAKVECKCRIICATTSDDVATTPYYLYVLDGNPPAADNRRIN